MENQLCNVGWQTQPLYGSDFTGFLLNSLENVIKSKLTSSIAIVSMILIIVPVKPLRCTFSKYVTNSSEAFWCVIVVPVKGAC